MKTIELTQDQFAIVDDEEFENLSKYKWYAEWYKNTKSFRVKRQIRKGVIELMHRKILGITNPKVCVDHIDHETLNNQKSNLRVCNNQQNTFNRKKTSGVSRYKGVSIRRDINKWKATIRFNAKHIHLGFFENEIDAALAYDEAAKKHFGEFALLNFPELKS